MIQIFMLNRGDDFARFKRGEPIAVGPGIIVQLESRLSAKTAAAAPESHNGATPKGKPTKKPKRRRQWSDAQKKIVLADLKTSGVTPNKYAITHDISPSVLMGWMRKAQMATVSKKAAKA